MACDAESLVEKLYKRVQLPPEWMKQLEDEMEAEVVARQSIASEQRVVLTKRLAELAEEREKLLRAYYSNAIPLELLKKDQDRISSQEASAKSELEVTEADLGGWQEVLRLAIRLAGNCHAAYLKARPKVRRRFNEAVLQAVYIKDGKVKKAEFNDPFDVLSRAQVRISLYRWWGKDSNLRSLRNRFTAGSFWPLRYPTVTVHPQRAK